MAFEDVLAQLADPTQSLSASKLVALSSMEREQTDAFAGVWSEMEPRRRQQLVDELTTLAEDNVELDFDSIFLIALKEGDPAVRRAAIAGLWEYEGGDLLDALLGLLEHDEDAGVRADAGLSLRRFVDLGEFDTIPEADSERIDRALRTAFDNETEPVEVRARALEALGGRSGDWVHDLIEDAFESGDRRMTLSAAHAMGRSCDPGWLPTLIPELQSDDAEMRFEAAGALGAIADEEAVPHLVALLEDEDIEVQQAAIAALGETGGGEAKTALEELRERADERVSDLVEAALAEIELEDDPLAVKFGG